MWMRTSRERATIANAMSVPGGGAPFKSGVVVLRGRGNQSRVRRVLAITALRLPALGADERRRGVAHKGSDKGSTPGWRGRHHADYSGICYVSVFYPIFCIEARKSWFDLVF